MGISEEIVLCEMEMNRRKGEMRQHHEHCTHRT